MKIKREKFIDLANKRVPNALDKLRLVGNLADKRFYDYSENDAKEIIDTLQKEIHSIKAKFLENNKKRKKEFKLEI